MNPRQYCQEFQDARSLDFRVLGCQSTGMSVLGPGTSWTWIIRVFKCHLSEYRMWEYWDVRVLRFQCVGMWEYWDVWVLGCQSAQMLECYDHAKFHQLKYIHDYLSFYEMFSLCLCTVVVYWRHSCFESDIIITVVVVTVKKKCHKFWAIFVDKAWFCFISIMAMVLVLISNYHAF